MPILQRLRDKADEVIEIDDIQDIDHTGITGILKMIAIENLKHKNYYSFEQDGKYKLIILIHI